MENYIPSKRPVKSPLSLNEKTIVLNVFEALRIQNSTSSVESVVQSCSQMTGIGKTTIYKLMKDKKQGNITPSKPKSGRRKLEVDELTKQGIRRKAHLLYLNKEIPTLDKLLTKIKEDPEMQHIKRDKLWKILKELNFHWEKLNRKSILIERDEIVKWRRQYLRSIRQARESGQNIFYLDETWLNEGHTVQKMWYDKNIETPRQAFLEGLSTGLRPPTGKGKRLIITHIGSENGFVPGGLLAFQSKKTGDYHEDMNADVFEEWFEQVLDLIPTGSLIVMDNASYHSRLLEKLPTTSWRKDDIKQWLTSKNIPFDDDMVKKELLIITSEHKKRYVKYAVDEMAKLRGISVLRLPPYHCELNPIELVWAQVKGEVARKNTSYKLQDVEKHMRKAMENVTSDNWKNCVKHTMKEEEKMWKLDSIIENTIEPIIISTATDTSSDESSDDCQLNFV